MRIINTAPIRHIEAVRPIKPIKEVDKFIDFKYKLERNEFNKLLFLEHAKLKVIGYLSRLKDNENLSADRTSNYTNTNFKNTHSNMEYDKTQLACNRIAAYSKLMHEAESRKLMHEFNEKTKYNTIVSTLNKCHKDLVDFASMTLIINASYLISPNAVLALLNSKEEDV